MVTAEWWEQPQKQYDNSENEGHLFINYVFLHSHLNRSLLSAYRTRLLCFRIRFQVPTPDPADNNPDEHFLHRGQNIWLQICTKRSFKGMESTVFQLLIKSLPINFFKQHFPPSFKRKAILAFSISISKVFLGLAKAEISQGGCEEAQAQGATEKGRITGRGHLLWWRK